MQKQQTPTLLGQAGQGKNQKRNIYRHPHLNKKSPGIAREIVRLALIKSRNWGGLAA